MFSCQKEQTLEESVVDEWEAESYFQYSYEYNSPEPKERSVNLTNIGMSGTLFRKIILLNNQEVRLFLNYPSHPVKEEEYRGKYQVKSDSVFFTVQDIYFDGVKQTISTSLYVDPDLKNTLPFDYLKEKLLKFRFHYQSNLLEIYQKDYDREAGSEWVDEFGVKHTQLGRVARTEKVTYQRK